MCTYTRNPVRSLTVSQGCHKLFVPWCFFVTKTKLHTVFPASAQRRPHPVLWVASLYLTWSSQTKRPLVVVIDDFVLFLLCQHFIRERKISDHFSVFIQLWCKILYFIRQNIAGGDKIPLNHPFTYHLPIHPPLHPPLAPNASANSNPWSQAWSEIHELR